MVRVVERVRGASTLLIKKIAAETNELLESGAPILNLSQGCPDLPLCDSAYEAAIDCLKEKHLPYTEIAGYSDVREVCASFLNSVVLDKRQGGKEEGKSGGPYTAKHVCLTNGAVGAIYCTLAIQVQCPDDIVVAPLPAYGLYFSDTSLLGGSFSPLMCGSPEDGFAAKPSDIKRAFEEHGSRLRVLILCIPNNPTGWCLSNEQDAKSLASELDRQLAVYPDSFSVLLDEVYTGIASQHTSILKYASPSLRKVCFTVFSASKGLGSAPGARGGFVACADSHLMGQVKKMQMATGANISIVSQRILGASLSYILSNPQMTEIETHYREKTNYVCERLEQMGQKYCNDPRVFCPRRPQSTFYVLGRFKCLGPTDMDVMKELRDAYRTNLEKGERHALYGVAVVPLSAFSLDDTLCIVRICCAVDISVLKKAMDAVDIKVRDATKHKHLDGK